MPLTKYHYTEDKAQKALYVGNLIDEQKNISVLINAVEIVVKTYPLFKLTMVGGGSETDEFIKMAEYKGILNKEYFLSRIYLKRTAYTYLSGAWILYSH
jgi:glycosyltransferase involved in cell wall biosynthesis